MTLKLPGGFKVVSPAAEVKRESWFGRFVRHEKQDGSKFVIDEDYRLNMNRVAVQD